jgi:hypothetical protein
LHSAQTLINHVAIVLDASYSMKRHERTVAQVVDQQIRDLNDLSREHNQETRVSVYHFGGRSFNGPGTIECLIFDMDVARIPSADGLYRVLNENTALRDAFGKSQDDLATTSTLYGDHAFLTFVLSDGQENASEHVSASDMRRRLGTAPENWSVGFLVPDAAAVRQIEGLGALRDQIAVWDISSAKGLLDAGKKMQTATSNFFLGRAAGVRGTRSVFSTGLDAVNKRSVKTNLEPLNPGSFTLLTSAGDMQIRDLVRDTTGSYVTGSAYYLLRKKETIQPRKKIIVVEKASGKAFTGDNARHLIGLPDGEYVDVRPDANPAYDIYVQSKSVNRKVTPKDSVLVLA